MILPEATQTPSTLRTAVVTGAGGFIGGALVARLAARDVRTSAFDLAARAVNGIQAVDLADPQATSVAMRL